MKTNPANIIAVSTASLPKAAIDRAGAFVLWRLSGTTNVQKLNDAWLEADLDLAQLPDSPSEDIAFSRAIREHATGNVISSKLEDGGWALIAKRSAKDARGADLKFATELRVWLEGEDKLRFEPEHDGRASKIRADFIFNQRELSQQDMSNWLVRHVKRLDAVPLRDTGGVYFIPHASLAEWAKIVDVLRQVSGHKIFSVPALENDADTVALILDGVAQEAEALFAAMNKTLTEEPGARLLTSRKDQLKEFEEKLKRYEGLLGTRLDVVRTQLDEVDDQVAMALVAAEAAKEKAARKR